MKTILRPHSLRLTISAGLLACTVFAISLTEAASAQAVNITSEPELIDILASDSERSEKAMACKRLAIYGSEASVPELAKLLGDAELASWARIAIEAIPSDASDLALREAAGQLDGLLLVGVINSIGVRRDAQAVDLLDQRLRDASAPIAESAALALGRIGNEAAAQALRGYLPEAPEQVRSSVAEGCLLIADRQFKEGNTDLAREMFDEIRSSDLPRQRIVEATRGAILVRGEEGIPLLKEQLRSGNRKMLAVGLQTARELSSQRLGAALIEEISTSPPDRAALIVEVLGDLSGQTDLNSLLSLAEKGSREVRLAAISVLGRVGDRSCVAPLLKIAGEGSDLQAAVRASLVAVPDDQVNQEILDRLPEATDDKLLLVELIGLRQLNATDQLIQALDDNDTAVRNAALQALGETVPQERIGVLVQQVVQHNSPEDLSAATRALGTAAIRMPDRDYCAGLLGEALENAPRVSQLPLLETIAAVGGTKALNILAEYAKSSDEPLRDVSTRLLGEWMTIDVAPVLLDLATTGPADRFQVRAMRGYIRVARQFVMPDEDRVQMSAEAMKAAKNIAEQRLVLEVLQRYPSLGTLQIALDAGQKPGLNDDARKAAQAIGRKLGDNAEAQRILQEAGL